uniref:Ovule protein n=1 Tax=Heterorhabditis bacteriophora TaxID=37862 RepID=A0A1I7WPZ1_HETBA
MDKRVGEVNPSAKSFRSSSLPYPYTSFITAFYDLALNEEDCSYCCFTIIALSIAFCSAVITFLVANYMYTGIPCHDDTTPFQLPDETTFILFQIILPLRHSNMINHKVQIYFTSIICLH